MTWDQAMAMLEVRSTLTDKQSQALLDLRNQYTLNTTSEGDTRGIERGRQLYSQCTLCHSSNSSIAPTLNGIVGGKVASDKKFRQYSPSLKEFSLINPVWTDNLLDQFIKSPKIWCLERIWDSRACKEVKIGKH